MKAICSVCSREKDDVRIRTDSGGFGPVDVQTCRVCHEKEMASLRQESRRLGFKLKTTQWGKLTTRGAYSEVVKTAVAGPGGSADGNPVRGG